MRISRLEKKSSLGEGSKVDTETLAVFIARNLGGNWASLDDDIQRALEKLGVYEHLLVIKMANFNISKTEYQIVVAPDGKRTKYTIVYDIPNHKLLEVVKGDLIRQKRNKNYPPKKKKPALSPADIAEIAQKMLDNGVMENYLDNLRDYPLRSVEDKANRAETLLDHWRKNFKTWKGGLGLPSRMDRKTKQAIIDIWMDVLPDVG